MLKFLSFSLRTTNLRVSNTYLSQVVIRRRPFSFSSLQSKQNDNGETIKQAIEGKANVVDRIGQFLCGDILPTFLSHMNHTIITNERKLNDVPIVLLLGVSGGCDSIALLHCIMNLATITTTVHNNTYQIKCTSNTISKHETITPHYQIHVVHFDHQQRGTSSDSDRIFVQNLCSEMNLPFHCYFWQDEADKETNDNHSFSQEKARNWRMQKMQTLLSNLISSSNVHAGLIVTAHHADDSDETLLLKLLRGAHVTNLSGIEPIVFVTPVVAIARPLLCIRKEEIIDFLTRNGLTWREDESNKSDKYLRNRVRNELIPLINDMVGGKEVFQQRLQNMQEQSKALKDDLTNRVDEYLKINNITFPSSDSNTSENTTHKHLFPIPSSNLNKLNMVQYNALHHWCNACMKGTHRLEYIQVQRIQRQLEEYPSNKKWVLNVGKGWNVVRDKGTLEMVYDPGKKRKQAKRFKGNLD